MDSGVSLSCGGPHEELIQTGELSSKAYMVPMRQIVSASKGAKLDGKIIVSEDAVIQGWRDPALGLYQIPPKAKKERIGIQMQYC
ncbi:hypothetical protein ACHAW6_009388 [Cyclotella cf. meneghiniana]